MQARSAASSHSLSPCQSGCSPSEPAIATSADGWHIVVLRLTPPLHGDFRDGIQRRVCPASGRGWHWYRSHGATELSLATLRRSVSRRHRRSTLYVEVLGVLVDLCGRHSRNRGPLRMQSRLGGSVVFAPGGVASLGLNLGSRRLNPRPNLTRSTGLGGKRRGWCFLCGQCTRWQTAGRPERCTNTGHRDRAYSVAEISSTRVPTAWPSSVRRECAYSLSEISPCLVRTTCRRSARVIVSIDRAVSLIGMIMCHNAPDSVCT